MERTPTGSQVRDEVSDVEEDSDGEVTDSPDSSAGDGIVDIDSTVIDSTVDVDEDVDVSASGDGADPGDDVEFAAASTSRGGHPRWPKLVLAVATVVIIADQLSKWWALERLDRGRIIDVVGSLRFNLAFNSGTAFSLGENLGSLIAVVAVVISAALFWAARQVTKASTLFGVGLVVGGALGNFIDRLARPAKGSPSGFLRGSVVDFIDLQWWPIFNIADAAIVCGGILIVVLGGFADEVPKKA